MRFALLFLAFFTFSCEKKYIFQVPSLGLSGEDLIEKVVALRSTEINDQKLLSDYRVFLKEKKFTLSELEILHLISKEKTAEQLFATVNLAMQLSSASIVEFVEKNEIQNLESERIKLLKEIAEHSGYSKNISETLNRFQGFMERLPVTAEQREQILLKQKLALEASIYYAHRKTDLKEIQKIHYLLTSSAYRKNLEFWGKIQENQLHKSLNEIEKALPHKPSPNK